MTRRIKKCCMQGATARADVWLGVICAAAAASAGFCSGCAEQRTLDSKVYRVEGGEGTNYYRVRLTSRSFLSQTDYQTGLFPAYAVDAFLGKEAELSSVVVNAENKMREQVAAAQVSLHLQYMEAIKSGDDKQINELARRLRELQLVPVPISSNCDGSLTTFATTFDDTCKFTGRLGFQELQTNPIRNLIDYFANKKYVIAISADPDAILGQITAFAEEAETTKAFSDAVKAVMFAASGVNIVALQRTMSELSRIGKDLSALGSDTDGVKGVEDLRARINSARAKLETLP